MSLGKEISHPYLQKRVRLPAPAASGLAMAPVSNSTWKVLCCAEPEQCELSDNGHQGRRQQTHGAKATRPRVSVKNPGPVNQVSGRQE